MIPLIQHILIYLEQRKSERQEGEQKLPTGWGWGKRMENGDGVVRGDEKVLKIDSSDSYTIL